MKKQDILEDQVNTSLLGIGSNLGDRKLNITKAKLFLHQNNIRIIKSSNFYENVSWPNSKFPKYLNIVIEVETYLNPLSLFKLVKSIEFKLGRKKNLKNYPRSCDIDIIDFNKKKININKHNIELKIPHPRAHKRIFVLLPLHEISKEWVHPKFKQNVSFLLNKINCNDLRAIKLI